VLTFKKAVAAKEENGIKCPYCNSRKVAKNGFRGDNQRYICKSKGCKKSFTSLTKTIFASTKKKFTVWLKYIECMIDKLPLHRAAEKCEIHINTAFVWRQKILDALGYYCRLQYLRGVVEADDILFKLSFKGNTPEGRKAHRRGTPAKKPGTSKEYVSIACVVDRTGPNGSTGNIHCRAAALGRPGEKELRKALGKRRFLNIKKPIVICTDKDRAHAKFAAKRHFKHIPLKGPNGQLGIYHIQHVNSYHSGLRKFIERFEPSTKYHNNYMVWFNMITKKKRRELAILELCMKSKRATLWRDISKRPLIPFLTNAS
jgi:transposase-like protein